VAELGGVWVGDWTTGGQILHPTMLINQGGGDFTGTFSVLGTTIAISGTVGTDRFSWTGAVPLCGSAKGDGSFSGAAPAQMQGGVEVNTLGCLTAELKQGTIVWRKGGS
jgi:hypothetical protein